VLTTTNETAFGSEMDQVQQSISMTLGVTADFDAALEVKFDCRMVSRPPNTRKNRSAL
jgi:hypothetical protein